MSTEHLRGAAFSCETCGAVPLWEVLRRGDAALSWACGPHLSTVCEGLQRDWEITELVVTHQPKGLEWARIHTTLEAIAKEDDRPGPPATCARILSGLPPSRVSTTRPVPAATRGVPTRVYTGSPRARAGFE